MMILHNLKVAWRNLMKYKTQNIVSIVALAVGIVTLAATHFVLKHLGPPSIAKESYYDRCYVMCLYDEKMTVGNESAPNAELVLEFISNSITVTPEMDAALNAGGALPGVEKMLHNYFVGGLMRGSDMTFTMPDSTTRTRPSDFFAVEGEKLNFHAIRSALTGEKVPVLKKDEAVISEMIARQVYGDKNPVGCKVSLWNDMTWMTFTIRDVYRAGQLNDGVTNAIYITKEENEHGYIACYLMLLAEGQSPEQVRKEADRRLEPLGISTRIESLDFVYTERRTNLLRVRTIVYLTSSLILVAALIGFLKMQLQLFRMRRREVSLRRVHGAKGRSIMRLFFTEMVLTIVMAFMLALLLGNMLAGYAGEYLAGFLDEFGWRIDGINSSIMFIAVAVTILCAVVVWCNAKGMLHSRQAMAAQMHRSRRHTLRNGMLGLQLFISILFLGSTLALSHFIGLMEKQCNVPENDAFYAECICVQPSISDTDSRQFLEYLQTGPKGIKQYIKISEDYTQLEGLDNVEAEKVSIHSPFFTTLQVSDTAILDFWQRPIKWFLPPGQRNNCMLLSDSLYSRLSRLGLTDNGSLLVRSRHAFPIGGTFPVLPYMDNNSSFQTNCIVELGHDGNCFTQFIIVPEEGEYDRVFTELEDVMRRINPEPVKPTVMNLHEEMTKELFLLNNMEYGAWILSAICFVICFMGIWSSISLDTRSRQKEIAVRKVHGAKRKDVVAFFARLYVWLVAVASVMSMPLMVIFNTLLQEWGMQQGIPRELVSPVIPIIMSISIVSLVVALVVGVHIRKMMRLQPADIIAKE